MRAIGWAVLLSIPIAAPAAAAVKSSTPQGFEIVHEATVPAPAAAVYAALLQPGRWWSKDHTWSGDTANLSLDPRPGGCFCEALPDGGGVEHMRVAFLRPGTMLRLRGALGPLQGEGVDGALTFALAPVGKGTKISLDFVAGGYFRMGVPEIAPAADGMLGETLAGLVAYLEKSAK